MIFARFFRVYQADGCYFVPVKSNQIRVMALAAVAAFGALSLLVPLGDGADEAFASNPECDPTPDFYDEGDTTYKFLTFDDVTTCDWTVPARVTSVDVLVVGGGGGGGGGSWGGGGGAGGVLYAEDLTVGNGDDIAITVGAGGAGKGDNGPSNGGDSKFGDATADGGGAGGYKDDDGNGQNGGSGGGASNTYVRGETVLSASSPWQTSGNEGGDDGGELHKAGGGGGGADLPGSDSDGFANGNGGDGGDGKTFAITGQEVDYAGGGGGSGSSSGGDGGDGGGGDGGDGGTQTRDGADGVDGLGGGGGAGGGFGAGGNGGSGVVIVRYAEPIPASITIDNPTDPVGLTVPSGESGDWVHVPVTLNDVPDGTYQAFVSVPEDAGTLSVTSSDVEALDGYDDDDFTRLLDGEFSLGFEGPLTEVEAALDTLLLSSEDAPQAEITVDIAQATSGAIIANASALVVPGAAQNVSAALSDSSFTFSWSAPDDSENSVTDYEYSTDGGGTWESVGSATTSVDVDVSDVCDDLVFEVRALIGEQEGTSSSPITVSGCNTITVVASGGASEGSGWSSTAGVITATRDVSIDATDVETELSSGDLEITAHTITINEAVDSGSNGLTLTATSAIAINADIDINAPISVYAGTISQSRGVSVTSGGSDIEYTVSASPWTANGDTAIFIGKSGSGIATINAEGGNVSLSAGFAASGTHNSGDPAPADVAVRIESAVVKSTGSGTVTINGDASDNASTSGEYIWGLVLGHTTVIETDSGSISLSGTAGKARTNARGIASNNTSVKVVSDSGAISLTDTIPADLAEGLTYTGMYLNPSADNKIQIGADGDRVSESSSDITIAADRLSLVNNDLSIDSTGSLTIEPTSDSFASTLLIDNVALSNLSGLRVGKTGNTGAVTVATAGTVDGPITIHSDAISVQAALEATDDTVTFQGAAADDSKGTLTNTAAGTITADNLLIRNIHNTSLRSNDNVSVDVFAATGGHRILLSNDQTLELGTVAGVNGVSASEWVAIDTTNGNLSITQQVGTTLTTSSWGLRLEAASGTAFGTASGGDVIVPGSGSGAFNAPNAQTHVFSGSAANSTGLSARADEEVVYGVAPTVAAGDVGVAYRSGPPVFSSATTMRFDDELSLVAVDPAGGAITFSKVNSGDLCTITNGVLKPSGIGDCEVRASSTGGATAQTVAISEAPQSIAFTSSVPTSAVSGTTYTPAATATSGLSVEFSITSGSPSVCTLVSGVVTFQASGSCIIEASIADGQSGATNYLDATAVSQTIVAGKINQTISFSVIADRNYGDPSFAAGATVSSGRTVTYSSPSSSSSVCRVDSSTGVVDLLDVGDCTITAASAADSSYAAAPDVTRTFTVRAVVPTVTSLTSASFGDGRITVGFTPPESDGGAAVTGYRAVATPTGSGDVVQQTCASTSPCTVTGLDNGTEYEVTLAAINSAGVGAASDASPAVTPATAPRSVSDLRTIPGNEQLVVQWTRAEDFGGGTFSRYEVYLRESGQSWPGSATQNVTTESDESVTFTGLTNGTAYDVKVVTISSVNSTELEDTNLTTAFGVPVTVPEAPTDFSVTALSATTALASWKAPADNGGTVITSYTLSSSCTFESDTNVYCTLTGLTPGSSTTITLGATNYVGTGATTQGVATTPSVPRNDSDDDDSDDSQEAGVTPPLSPSAAPGGGQTPRLPAGPDTTDQSDVVTGPIDFPRGTDEPRSTPRGFVGGVPAPVRTTPSADGGFDLSASTLRLGVRPGGGSGDGSASSTAGVFSGRTAGGSAGSSSGDTGFGVSQGGSTSFSGGGLLPDSALQVFLPGSSGSGGGAELARIAVNASGEFDGVVDFGRNPGEMPMPIGQQVLQAIAYDENGDQIVVELPVNIVQADPSPEWDREAGGVPSLAPGEMLATSAGLPESVVITALPEIGQVNAVADQWSVSVRVAGDAGSVEQAGASANVSLIQERGAEVFGSGFQPVTRVDVWLFSEPTLLGSVTVGDDGEFTSDFYLDPRFATIGEHTLQLQGVGTDGFVKAVNMGVSIDSVVADTSEGANTLVWWALGLFLLIVITLLFFALSSRRRQSF